MKIIGNTGNRHFLVECEEDELAVIAGYSYAHELREKGDCRLEIGLELDTRQLREYITDAKRSRRALDQMPDQLRKLADRLDARTPRWRDPDAT